MAADNQIHLLNSLIETVIDSADGYRKAGEASENPRFKSLFTQRAGQRAQLATKLQAEVRRLGGTPEDDGTILAKAHRTFLDLKDKVAGRDDKAVIEEVDRGEDFLKGKFEAAAGEADLAPETRTVIDAARAEVKSQHDEISALKHAA